MNNHVNPEMLESYGTMKEFNDNMRKVYKNKDEMINILSDINGRLENIGTIITDVQKIRDDCKSIQSMITDLYWN